MRKRHFTPAMLNRWRRENRGSGTGKDYIPWHQVRPADPPSRGRSHLINWRFGRLHHLLSDIEAITLGFVSMLDNIIDVREQFPLALDSHLSDAAPYSFSQRDAWSAGTLEIADALGIRHPVTRGDGETVAWVMSTDMVVTLGASGTPTTLLAISVKNQADLSNKRTLEKLKVEREYWLQQNAAWLLITPALYEMELARTMQSCMAWVLWPDDDLLWPLVRQLGPLCAHLSGRTWAEAVHMVEQRMQVPYESAQRLFWRCVWKGMLPLDLTKPLRPANRLSCLSEDAFWLQNPVVSRRTAWRS